MHNIVLREFKSANKMAKLFGTVGDASSILKGWKKHFGPESRFRKIWATIIFLGHFYYCFSIPFMLGAILEPWRRNLPGLILGYCVDLLFVVDLFFQIRLNYYIYEGIMVTDPGRLWKTFKETKSVPFEILAAFPFDLLGLPFLLGPTRLAALRCIKMVRLKHVFSQLEQVREFAPT